MVLAYKPLAQSDHDNHMVHACGGTVKYQLNGKDIVVASVDEHKTPINIATAKAELSRVSIKTKRYRHGGKRKRGECGATCYYVTKKAHEIFSQFSSTERTQCSPSAALAIVGWGQDVYVHYRTSRFASVDRESKYHLFMFG